MKGKEQLTVYRNCVPVVDTRYENDGDTTITEVLVDALAEAEGVVPTDVASLYEAVDPDALSQLFEERGRGADAETLLSFTFENWNVFVRGDGRIRVCDGTRATDPALIFEDTPA